MIDKNNETSRLSEAQLFGLALDGILATQNNSHCHTLFLSEPTEENVSIEAETLSRDWGIRSTEELKESLERLISNQSHSHEFKHLVVLLGTFDSDEKRAFIESYRQRPEQYAKLTIADRALYSMQQNGIFAWDCGRYVHLCRSGAMIGLLSQKDAWLMIMQIARHVQPMFKDWYAYGTSYVTGRHFWNASLSANHVNRMMGFVKQLCTGENAPWTLPWDLDLSDA